MAYRPILYVSEILEWADAYYALHGVWPSPSSGLIPGPYWDTWKAAEMALHKGLRSLRAGQTLARLLEEHRDRRNHAHTGACATKRRFPTWRLRRSWTGPTPTSAGWEGGR